MCIDGDSEELDEEQTSRFRSSVLESCKGTRTQKRKIVETIIETSKALSVTERRLRSDELESHQEEVKKPEEQASAVTQTAEFPESALTTADSPHDGREEEIAKFGGDIIRNVSIVNNLNATSEGLWLGGNKNRVTSTDEMRAEH